MNIKDVVFDLDDTLVNTRQAVENAYRAAGVEMPQNAWGRPWREWLTAELCYGRDPAQVHDDKNAAYANMLTIYASPMPLLRPVVETRARIITGASLEAVRAVEARFIVKLNVQLYGASKKDKRDYLSTIGTGIYVDDDPVTRSYISEHTTWKTFDPAEFLRSFLRREPTPA